MSEQLFVFVQMEFPWALGPPDGRYLLRAGPGGEPERVVVLGTVGAQRTGARAPRLARRRARGAGATVQAPGEPPPVPVARATLVDPVPVAAAAQASAWLEGLDRDSDVRAAFAVLNRVLALHRVASADPYVHEVQPALALAIRAGWGAGEQVADGRWLHAAELPFTPRERAGRAGRRTASRRSQELRPLERLAQLLAARARPLVCEELALRARLDLDNSRTAHAALELDHAYAAALAELRAEHREELALRIDELAKLREGVGTQARAALALAAAAAGEPGAEGDAPPLDADALEHALERLEAALRARAASLGLRRAGRRSV